MPTTFALRLDRQLQSLITADVAGRIWSRDGSVWSGPRDGAATGHDPQVAAAIGQRLGWLDAPDQMAARIDALRTLATDVARDARTALLLGMGGSSLCAEALRARRGPRALDVLVLDTTDAGTLRGASRACDPEATVYLVASKSGTTIEVASLEAFFREQAVRTLGVAAAGRRFVAVTDPGTPLERHAEAHGYHAALLNPADIGGRFSVLSSFGLLPCALLDADPAQLVAGGQAMARRCRESTSNPGLELGAFMAAAAEAGRDKLTLLLPPALVPFGLWVEQLVAESTGKQGRGLLPVVDEPPGPPESYGPDRAFVAVGPPADLPVDAIDALERHGHPVLRIDADASALGGEFFRWEFATAVAGAALRINPFDEPNVREAKDRTGRVLEAFLARGAFPDEPPVAADGEVSVFGGTSGAATPADALRAHLSSANPGDYVALLSYLPAGSPASHAFDELRAALRRARRLPSTFGLGPRYLHSTGQYHKGGPDRIVAVMVTADESTSTQIPERPYTFEALKHAQALGDFQALAARSRRVLRLHLRAGADHAGALTRLFRGAVS